MDARDALGDAYAAGARQDALLESAAQIANQVARRVGPADAASLLASGLLPLDQPTATAETLVDVLARRLYDELYDLAYTRGWLRAVERG
jgi:hypothetical protein